MQPKTPSPFPLGTGFLVVGHGTRSPEGVRELLTLATSMRAKLDSQFIDSPALEACFLELASPTIETAVGLLSIAKCDRIVVIPILLFEAGHALQDIPDEVARCADARGMKIMLQSPPLELHEAALILAQRRFEEALRCSNSQGCLKASKCDVAIECTKDKVNYDFAGYRNGDVLKGRIGLAMVGRGSSDTAARDKMRHFTSALIRKIPIELGWSSTGFFTGDPSNVQSLLDEAQASDCGTIVVQPHLLFEGLLVEDLRRRVDTIRQSASNTTRWLVTPTLGADDSLADAYLKVALTRFYNLTS